MRLRPVRRPTGDVAGCEECLKSGDVGAPADVPELRPHRLLRQLAGQHATAHYHETGHPIIRSVEPGEDWSWCYVDEVMFRLRPLVSPARPELVVVGRRLEPADHRLRDYLTPDRPAVRWLEAGTPEAAER